MKIKDCKWLHSVIVHVYNSNKRCLIKVQKKRKIKIGKHKIPKQELKSFACDMNFPREQLPGEPLKQFQPPFEDGSIETSKLEFFERYIPTDYSLPQFIKKKALDVQIQ